MVRAVCAGQSTGRGFDLACFSCLSLVRPCICSLHGAVFICFLLHSSPNVLVSWAWWDWPLTCLTNHRPSVLWRCWLCHVIHTIVYKMTYNVLCLTLIPYHLFFLTIDAVIVVAVQLVQCIIHHPLYDNFVFTVTGCIWKEPWRSKCRHDLSTVDAGWGEGAGAEASSCQEEEGRIEVCVTTSGGNSVFWNTTISCWCQQDDQ